MMYSILLESLEMTEAKLKSLEMTEANHPDPMPKRPTAKYILISIISTFELFSILGVLFLYSNLHRFTGL